MENKISKLREDLSKGAVKFSYMKKDGSVREAFGTTNMNFIPIEQQPSDPDYIGNPNQIRYYDLDKKEWRSFISDNLETVHE